MVYAPSDSLIWIMILNKIDMPNSISYLSRTSIFEWYVVRCGSKRKYVLKKEKKRKITFSSYDNYSELNSEHNWERTHMTI